MLTLSNPAGLWALLGIPAVLAIHFLQRRAVILPVSTLFLLEKTQRESTVGRRFDRLMNSVPLWMQLLGVVLLTWLLSEPRYAKEKSTQRIAIVLDSSASMSVFKDAVKDQLASRLPALKGPASDLELTLIESAPGRNRLYAGASTDELLGAIDGWSPRDGTHDPSHSLRLARSLVSREGIVIYATDTPMERLPFDAGLLSVGDPVDNVGFTGCSIHEEEGAHLFRATVKNHSQRRVTRAWHVEMPDGSRTEPNPVELDPDSVVTIQAAFPRGANGIVLRLEPDRFPLDDNLPLIVPKPKKLSLFTTSDVAFGDLVRKLSRSLEEVEAVTDMASPDLTLVSYDPLDPVLPAGNAAIFVRDDTQGGAYLKGGIVTDKHPLVSGLNWQALLVRESIQLERSPSDQVLLWQGDRPLIFLREAGIGDNSTRQLCFNFDPRLSNALNQPAFIVMLHRFADSLRSAKIAPAAENLECGQPYELAVHRDGPAVVVETRGLGANRVQRTEIPASAIVRVPVPRDPGYLSVKQGQDTLLEAAVHFADSREANFEACAAGDTVGVYRSATIERHTNEDHWWRAWFLLLVAALVVSWHFTKERSSPSPETATV